MDSFPQVIWKVLGEVGTYEYTLAKVYAVYFGNDIDHEFMFASAV